MDETLVTEALDRFRTARQDAALTIRLASVAAIHGTCSVCARAFHSGAGDPVISPDPGRAGPSWKNADRRAAATIDFDESGVYDSHTRRYRYVE